MKILLGGVPLGCNNIGDEAILAGVVGMLRKTVPGAELAVATADRATAGLLGVEVLPPYGFKGVAVRELGRVAGRFDAYVWCGATGLSDYPHVGLDLLEAVQGAGAATFVWGVGMDDELNPAFFRVAGKKKALLGALGLVGAWERRLRGRLAARMSKILPRCKGVWVRDPESAEVLASTGFTGAGVTADSAVDFSVRTIKRRAGRRLGLCISTQRQVADLEGVKRLVAAVEASGGEVLGIPMNPKTDRALMEAMGVECMAGDTPEAVREAASGCAVVLSSRLHLLILAANEGTPGLGVARGSKIANWLANFGEKPLGTVGECDWVAATRRVLAALDGEGAEDWERLRAAAYARLAARFEAARAELAEKLKR
ncbi:MAG: polysaccharide pyruvyl transferase family protein [Kiritimatiellae bacterium]|nr:polysaccharide pyruvyl transferase family protein [Kiritimatiellia bacterium]